MPNVAIIGSGPSSIGFMDGIIEELQKQQSERRVTEEEKRSWQVDIFEKSANVGYGGPYDPAMTGAEHLFNGRNVSTFHMGEKESFFNWLQDIANQGKIDQKFSEVFCSRFEEKFRLFFPDEEYNKEAFQNAKNVLDDGYRDEPEYLRLKDKLGNKFENLCNYYIEDYEDIKSRYFRFAEQAEFLPRVAYGIYLNYLFEEKVESLKQLIGEQNVVIHASTNVDRLNSDSTLTFSKDGAEDSKKFDIIGAGTGRWQPDLEQEETGAYIVNAWPISRVEERVNDLIKKAKEDGKEEVTIAIEGSSLTAVDMSKTVLHNCGLGRFEQDGDEFRFVKNPDLGIDVKVDMVSRNGLMSLVRGAFSWMPEQIGKYYVDAAKQVAEQRGVDFSEFDNCVFSEEDNQVERSQVRAMNKKLIDEYAKQSPDGQIRLWQACDTFLEIGGASYDKAAEKCRERGEDEEAELITAKADRMKGFAAFVREHQDNYEAIINKYLEGRASNPFVSLQADLDDALKGDVDGDSVFEIVNKHFMGWAYDNIKLLPEEQILAKKYDSIYMSFDAPMPPESAKEMIAMNKAGVLNVVANGYGATKEVDDTVVRLGEKEYDLAINCTGTRLNFEKTQDSLYRSICDQYEIDADKVFLTSQQHREMQERIAGKTIFEDVKGKFKADGDGYSYKLGESEMKVINVDTSKNPDAPKIILSRNLVSVKGAADSSKEAIRKTIKEKYTPSVAVESTGVVHMAVSDQVASHNIG